MSADTGYMDWLFNRAKDRLPNAPFRTSVKALIVRNGRMEFMGHNSRKTHPLASRFSKHPEAVHIHAELDAIVHANRFLQEDEWKRCTLYIARAKYKDERKKVVIQGLAKPCEGCTKLIAYFGIGRVVYSLDNARYRVVE